MENVAEKKVVPPTFEGTILEFDESHRKILEQYSLDEDADLLGQHSDRLREEILPTALRLAKSRLECQLVLGKTEPRNEKLRAKIIAKMDASYPAPNLTKPQK